MKILLIYLGVVTSKIVLDVAGLSVEPKATEKEGKSPHHQVIVIPQVGYGEGWVYAGKTCCES